MSPNPSTLASDDEPRLGALVDAQLERVVLCHFLLQPDQLKEHDLSAELFSLADHEAIFRELIAQKNPTANTVASGLKKQGSDACLVLAEILDAPITSRVASEIDALRELYMVRETRAALLLAYSQLGNGGRRESVMGTLRDSLKGLKR